MRQSLKYLFFLVFLCVFTACSTKKNTFFTRAFHNTTTHYNWYFNGNESIKSGEKKLAKRHQDDYNQIIKIYPLGTEKDAQNVSPNMDKAIKKGAKAISKHSIFIKGEEYNRWIDDCYFMIAKAYFYKREYIKAIEAFRYINRQYQGTEKDYEAAIWLSRCYIENKDYSSANLLFNTLLADEGFPEKLNQPLSLAYAHYFIQIKDYPSAIEELQQAVDLTNKKSLKSRYMFVLAQLYHLEKNFTRATYYYDQVLKKSPDYEMAFNAKINKARAFDVESGDTQTMKDDLNKMLKDDKNKDYLDVIYFGLAELSMREEKTEEAIPLYRLSTAKSISNSAQKFLSSLSVGRIYYQNQNYRLAQVYYDTAVAFSNIDHPDYKQTLQRQTTLSGLIKNLDVIEQQDSLQKVATMPENERVAFIDEIIEKIKEEEQIQREKERNNRLENTFFNDGQNNNNRFNRHNQTNRGKWYFYNPTTLSFGYSEFNRKWGKRILEDDWRRKNKKTLTVSEIESDTIQEDEFDPKSRESYLKGLPLTVEEFKISNQMIIEAYYNAGVIYKEELEDFPQSVNTFEELNERFPKNENRVKTLYHLYRLQELLDNNKKSEIYKLKLLKEFPESEYAKLIQNPTYLKDVLTSQSEIETLYQYAHSLYLHSKYHESIVVCKKALEDHPANLLTPNFDFLIAIATGFIEGKEQIILLLKKVIELHQGHEVAESAKEILAHLLFGETKEEDSLKVEQEEIIDLGVEYIYKENTPHYFVIIFKDFDVPLDVAKAIFSDYHAEFYSLKRLNISSILLDEQTHMISIREFGDAKKSIDYYNAYLESEARGPFANDFTAFTIAAPNFPSFFKNIDVKGYEHFFKTTYLNKD